jgi:hypothetical protein
MSAAEAFDLSAKPLALQQYPKLFWGIVWDEQLKEQHIFSQDLKPSKEQKEIWIKKQVIKIYVN